jgi:hypothetical protein
MVVFYDWRYIETQQTLEGHMNERANVGVVNVKGSWLMETHSGPCGRRHASTHAITTLSSGPKIGAAHKYHNTIPLKF